MKKGNVLVIGNSGTGKSTLINAVLGSDVAKTGWGIGGTSKHLSIYENDAISFRLIDTIGFEPNFLKAHQAINAVKKWSKESVKEGNEENQINVIWFCVDGTSSKLFPKTIKELSKATSMWPSVPVIVVITKSYSVPDRERNIEMIHKAFAMQKGYSKNLHKIIPVVASTYVLNDSAFAAPEGIAELIDATNEVMPSGIKASEKDIAAFKISRKRALAQSVVATATVSGVVVGAVPVSFPDAFILQPIEVVEVNAIAKIYGIKNDEDSKLFLDSIVKVGTVSTVAKTVISSLRSIPGINLAASVVNAVIAGSIVAGLGEGIIYAFEQVYLGNKSVKDVDWVTKILESRLSSEFFDKVKNALGKLTENASKEEILKVIKEILGIA